MLSNIKLTKIGKNTSFRDKRGARIQTKDVGRRCLIRNGKNMFYLFPQEFMVGTYFKDYRFTKVRGHAIHIKKKKSKKKSVK